jgi:AcrR family transcriptional regulator
LPELGIEAASLYSHFKSKDEILETICFRKADEFQTAITETNDIYFNAEEKLRMAIKNHVRIIASDLNASTVFLREWRYLSSEDSKIYRTRHQYENEFRTIIQRVNVLSRLWTLNWDIDHSFGIN